MAKRRLTNRLSKQLSINKSSSSIGSGYLDPDTNILGEDRTFWWKNLGEKSHSSPYNHGNETSVQLNLNSDLSSIHDKSDWWKRLEFDEQNTSTLKHNYSAGMIKTHVMETSTSESEKELKVKRKRLPLRITRRKSDGNPFQDVLNDTNTTVPLKQAISHLNNNAADKEVLQRKSDKNENDSSSLQINNRMVKVHVMETSTSESEKELNIKKKRWLPLRASRRSDRNAFLDALKDNTTAPLKQASSHLNDNASDGEVLRRKSHENENDSSNLQTENMMAKTNVMGTSESEKELDIKKKRWLPLRAASRRSDSNAFLDVLNDTNTTPLKQASTHLSNNVSDREVSQRKSHENENDSSTKNINNKSQSSDESNVKMLHDKSVKRKPRFMRLMRQSLTAFEDVLSENTDTNISEEIPKQHIDIHDAKVPAATRSSNNSSKISVDRSNSKIEKNASFNRSSRRSSISRRSSKDNPNQDIELSDMEAPSLTNSRSPVDSPKRLASGSKNKTDEHTSFNRSSKRINISKDNSNPDIEFSNAKSPVTRSRSSINSPNRLASDSKSKINVNEHISFSRSSSRVNISKDNSNQDIELSDVGSPVTRFRSPVDSSKRLASGSKNKIDEHTSFNRERSSPLLLLRRINISKDNSNQDVELSGAESPSVTRSRSQVDSLKKLGSKSKIDKHTSFNRSSSRINISKDPNQDIELSDAGSPSVTRFRSPVDSPRRLASVSKSKSDMDKNISISRNVIDPSSPRDNPSQNTLDTSGSTSSPAKRSSKSAQRSKSKIDINKNISVDRSPRSSLRRAKKRLLASSDEEDQDNYILQMERSSGNSTEPNAKRSENVSLVVTEKENHADILTAQSESRANKSKTVTRPTSSIASYLIKDSYQGNRETLRREKSLIESDLQNRSVPIKKPSNEGTVFNIGKIVKAPRTIDTFFKQSSSSNVLPQMDKPSLNNQNLALPRDFNEKMKRIKIELEGKKNREVIVMKRTATNDKKKFASAKGNNAKPEGTAFKQDAKKTPAKVTKTVDKAFLVNGKVYRAPRLPRPKHWVTDNLYQFLWKRMEPKYNLTTRVKSEKFVQELAKIVSFIERRKKYENYEYELKALMKEMARLNIIRTRNDFYNFCFQFLPYELRVKVIPMLLPGNKQNIPYDPETLHTPLLDNE